MTATLSRGGLDRVLRNTTSDWRHEAACIGLDPEMFWPVNTDAQHEAAAYCRSECRVMLTCRQWADRRGITDGVWGGETEHQRRIRLAKRREQVYPIRTCDHCGKEYAGRGDRYCSTDCDKAARRANCGTPAAAARHRQHGEPVDHLCRLAESLYRASLRAKRKERATA